MTEKTFRTAVRNAEQWAGVDGVLDALIDELDARAAYQLAYGDKTGARYSIRRAEQLRRALFHRDIDGRIESQPQWDNGADPLAVAEALLSPEAR